MNAKPRRSDGEGSKDNNVFDEENGIIRAVVRREYELHWRLKLVRGEKKKRKQVCRPRAVGGAEICILNGLGFITVGLSSGVSNICDK